MGYSLAKIEAEPHGIDLGPLRPRIPEVLRTQSGKIELAPALMGSAIPVTESVVAVADPTPVTMRHTQS